VDLWTMRFRAQSRLSWKILATLLPRVPSRTRSTELYALCIEYRKVKTNLNIDQPTATRKAPHNKPVLLSKQTAPPLTSGAII